MWSKINNIKYNDLTFNIIETKILDFLYELVSSILRKTLEDIDDELFNNRDRDKEKISRYESRSIFLLDEVLDVDILGRATIKQTVNLTIE